MCFPSQNVLFNKFCTGCLKTISQEYVSAASTQKTKTLHQANYRANCSYAQNGHLSPAASIATGGRSLNGDAFALGT